MEGKSEESAGSSAATATATTTTATTTTATPRSQRARDKGRAGLLQRLRRLLPLALLFAGWYISSYFTDDFNKKIQRRLPVPATLTLLQFVAGGLLTALILRGLKLSPFIPLRRDQLVPILPIAACWTIGFLFTNISLGQTNVAFNHAVKATEPLFLVVIATFFFRRRYPLGIWLSLVPLAVGIALVAMSDFSFTFLGFLSASIANCCFTTRSLLVKDVLAHNTLDNLNLFYYISWISAAVVLGLAVPFELPTLAARWTEVDRHLLALAVGNGVLHYVYNQLSMLILAQVATLTHAVGNAARRFFVIMATVVLGGQTLTQQNLVGLVFLLVGAAAYVYNEARQQQQQQQQQSKSGEVSGRRAKEVEGLSTACSRQIGAHKKKSNGNSGGGSSGSSGSNKSSAAK